MIKNDCYDKIIKYLFKNIPHDILYQYASEIINTVFSRSSNFSIDHIHQLLMIVDQPIIIKTDQYFESTFQIYNLSMKREIISNEADKTYYQRLISYCHNMIQLYTDDIREQIIFDDDLIASMISFAYEYHFELFMKLSTLFAGYLPRLNVDFIEPCHPYCKKYLKKIIKINHKLLLG